MAWFSRKVDTITPERRRLLQEEGERRAVYARSAPTVLRASGVRIKPMAADRMRAVAGQKQQWQALAWGYRDMIGELRHALQFRARAISRVQFLVAQVSDDDDEPLPVSLRHDTDKDSNPSEKSKRITVPADLCEAAEQELARLPLDAGYGFLGVWSENFDVAGECWLHGRVDPETDTEEWQIRSVEDVDVQGSSMTVRDELGQPRRVDLEAEELYRLWVPHPRRAHMADSSLNAAMDVLEDITLIGRELRAAARSRIATNGVLLVPNGMIQLRNVKADDDQTSDRDKFMAELVAALLAPISNEGDAGAIAPLVLTGSVDDLKAFRHVPLSREDSPTLLDKLSKALGRMATSLDIPPEILTGMGDVNHWTAWQIDNATFRHYLEPSIRLMADSLTTAFLRAALLAQGFPADQVRRLRIWYDAGQITENPNRRQDALDAADRAMISPDTFREALGFNDADAPTEWETLQMIAARQGLDQAAATAILRWAAEQSGETLPDFPNPTGTPRLPPGQVQRPAAEPDPSAPGGSGTPDTSPPAVAASAERAPAPYRLDVDTPRRLMEVERALRDQLLAAADAAAARALERAGSRLRSKATRRPEIAANLRDTPVTQWAGRLGREETMALGADARFLLAEVWDDLQGKFSRWVGAAVDAIAERVLALLGLDPESRAGRATAERMRADMDARIPAAWARLEADLNTWAERRLFGEPDPDDPADATEGEMPEFDLPPRVVRRALAVVGGLPEDSAGLREDGRTVGGEPLTGLATGRTVTSELEAAGVLTIGYLWVYGVTPLARAFHPHRELEGARFASWTDPKLDTGPGYAWVGYHFRPGDHTGCMCDYVPGYAVPEYADAVRDALGVPSQPTQDILNLAALDDREGRTGTTAQAVRDQWLAIQRLQARFIQGGPDA